VTNKAVGGATVRMIELGRLECLALLAAVPVGRVGFTREALLVIRPVNHLVDGDAAIIRTQTRAPVPAGASWSPAGPRHRTNGRGPLPRPSPALDRRDFDEIVHIHAELVTGYRLAR
jgi:hypothetical protein